MTKEENNELWNKIADHIGHDVVCVRYGDEEDPADVCIECETCGEVILDAELYTLRDRDDVEGVETEELIGRSAIEKLFRDACAECLRKHVEYDGLLPDCEQWCALHGVKAKLAELFRSTEEAPSHD